MGGLRGGDLARHVLAPRAGPGARKNGWTTRSATPSAAQAAIASAMEGAASSRCATYTASSGASARSSVGEPLERGRGLGLAAAVVDEEERALHGVTSSPR